MGTTYRTYSPDQQLLLPLDMNQWLAKEHLVWFISDVVDQMDLSAFHAPYQGSCNWTQLTKQGF